MRPQSKPNNNMQLNTFIDLPTLRIYLKRAKKATEPDVLQFLQHYDNKVVN